MTRKRFACATGVAHVYRSTSYTVQGTDAKTGDIIDIAKPQDVISLGLLSAGRAITCTTIPVPLWQAILLRVQHSKHPNISDVERFLRNEGQGSDAARDAPALFVIAKESTGIVIDAITHSPGTFEPMRYQAVRGLVTEDGKPLGRAVAPSLVTHPAVVPNRSYNNDLASITGRVHEVLNNVEPPPRYLGYARDFVAAVVGSAVGKGTPLELQEVIELQDRPTQRGRSTKVMQWIGMVNPVRVKSFMKGETYNKPTDPRNISTVGAEHTIRLSAFTYAFKRDVLYNKAWYAPGKPPREIAQRVAMLASVFAVLSETDYSRFDGTISKWLRGNVERACYLSWAAVEYIHDLGSLLDAEMNPTAITSEGLPYEPMASRLSGSPLTTDGNTLINTFVSYCAARLALLSHERAMELLGVSAGDDGLSPIKPQYLEKAARELGLRLKCERRNDGHMSFLGRVFYGASGGCIGSVQDPMRTWQKLHISFAPRIYSDRQALANRAAGYRTLDPEAPVLREWCEKVRELTGLEGCVDSDSPYFSQLESKDPEFGGWPQLTYEDGLDAISWRTGYAVDEIAAFAERIRDAESLDGLEHLLNNDPPQATIPVVMEGRYLTGPESVASQQTDPYTRRKPSAGVGGGRRKDHHRAPNPRSFRRRPQT